MNKDKTEAKDGIVAYMDNAKSFFDQTVKGLPNVSDSDKAKMYELSAQNYNQTLFRVNSLFNIPNFQKRLRSKTEAKASIFETLEHIEVVFSQLMDAHHPPFDPTQRHIIELNLKEFFDLILADIDSIRVSD